MAKKTGKKTVRVNPDQPFNVGAYYLIRTVTNYITGKIVCVGRSEVVV